MSGQRGLSLSKTDQGPSTGSGREVRRGLGWSTVSNLVLRVGNFAVSLIMARLIAPDQFGVFAVALTVWSVLGTLAEFGLGSDLVRARDPERRIPTVATMGLLTSGALAAGMALLAGPLAAAFRSPDSAPVIMVMAIALAVFGFGIVPAAMLQRAFRQRTLFLINGAALLCSSATLTVLALLGHGPMALAIGQVTTQVVTVLGLFLATRLRLRLGFDRRIAAESAAFCLPLAGANLLSWLLITLDNLIVARVLSPFELGLYVLAFNVSSWPMTAIGQSVRVVALPAFARLETRAEQGRALVAASGPVWAVALLVGVGLATLAGPAIGLLYGDRWRPAALALGGLALFGAVRVLFDLFATYLISLGATRPVLLVQVGWLLIMVPGMVAGISWLGLAGAGLAHLAIGLCFVLPAYLFCLHRVGVRPSALLRSCLVPLLVIMPTVGALLVLAGLGLPDLAVLALGAAVAAGLYVVPLHRWWLRRIRSLEGVRS
ncbi:oligosaccharide flippase family protein [Microlunatus sp. GCM10028923]|uniref:oligosaccharide flippase family protein n=1 Tax=Microlunatus sp. GCM10028923 TaxID=3273400 RepID=UPI003611DB91